MGRICLVSPTHCDAGTSTTGENFYSGPLLIGETNFGGLCLLFSVCLSMLQKKIGKKVAADLGGGVQRLFSFAVPLSALILLPFGLVSYFMVLALQLILNWHRLLKALHGGI